MCNNNTGINFNKVCLFCMGVPMIEIRQSQDHSVFIIGTPIHRKMVFILKSIWGLFHMRILSYKCRNCHYGDKMILWPSLLHNEISYIGKTAYWIRALGRSPENHLLPPCSVPSYTCHVEHWSSLADPIQLHNHHIKPGSNSTPAHWYVLYQLRCIFLQEKYSQCSLSAKLFLLEYY